MIDWHERQVIGDVLMAKAPYLKMYTDYSSNYGPANKAYLELIEKNYEFLQMIEVCHPHTY